jgi:haloacetate dehalogenase
LFSDELRVERRRANGIELNVRYDARSSGARPPLLLLHGFPQTHAIWHAAAERLRRTFTLVMPDLRGYGDSDKPASAPDHSIYSKRTMARDMVELMRGFGFDRFFVCGHDRGGRVAHRLALDAPECVRSLMLLDISPTLTMYERTTMEFARRYYHWFFLIQPAPLPERLIGADPEFYIRFKLSAWSQGEHAFFAPGAVEEYVRCFSDPAAIAASCEDYRAAATIDLEHDAADADCRIAAPVLVLWGDRGLVGRSYDVLATWREKAVDVRGHALPTGHYLPEEAPQQVADALAEFFGEHAAPPTA